MIELQDLKESAFKAIKHHIETNRNKSVFDIDFQFPESEGMFCFRGHWHFSVEDESRIEVFFSEAWIQFPDFEAKINDKYVYDIQDYIKKEEL